MLEVKLTHAATIKKLLDGLREFVTNANLEFTPTGMTVMMMDSSQVSLVHIQMGCELFEFFRCDLACVQVGVQLDVLNKMLRAVANTQSVTLRKEDDAEELAIICDGDDGGDGDHREAVMKLIDCETESFQPPECEYDCVFDLPAKVFNESVKILASIGNNVVIEANCKGASLETVSDTNEHKLTLTNGDGYFNEGSSYEYRFPDKSTSLSQEYDLSHLSRFCKASAVSDKATMCLKEGAPLCVKYPMDGDGFFNIYLAPKLSD